MIVECRHMSIDGLIGVLQSNIYVKFHHIIREKISKLDSSSALAT